MSDGLMSVYQTLVFSLQVKKFLFERRQVERTEGEQTYVDRRQWK